jgi:uncharacterized protein YqjF (DUF2071 family)
MVSVTAEQHVSVPMLRASWLNIAFVHWRVPADRIQALLPPGLTVDEYDGAAWVGLTPFMMANMRPLGVPDLPGALSLPGLTKTSHLGGVSSTPETNLRTYVRGPDGRDGLWFLTIDVGSAALAAALRLPSERRTTTRTWRWNAEGTPSPTPAPGAVPSSTGYRSGRESRSRLPTSRSG